MIAKMALFTVSVLLASTQTFANDRAPKFPVGSRVLAQCGFGFHLAKIEAVVLELKGTNDIYTLHFEEGNFNMVSDCVVQTEHRFTDFGTVDEPSIVRYTQARDVTRQWSFAGVPYASASFFLGQHLKSIDGVYATGGTIIDLSANGYGLIKRDDGAKSSYYVNLMELVER